LCGILIDLVFSIRFLSIRSPACHRSLHSCGPTLAITRGRRVAADVGLMALLDPSVDDSANRLPLCFWFSNGWAMQHAFVLWQEKYVFLRFGFTARPHSFHSLQRFDDAQVWSI